MRRVITKNYILNRKLYENFGTITDRKTNEVIMKEAGFFYVVKKYIVLINYDNEVYIFNIDDMSLKCSKKIIHDAILHYVCDDCIVVNNYVETNIYDYDINLVKTRIEMADAYTYKDKDNVFTRKKKRLFHNDHLIYDDNFRDLFATDKYIVITNSNKVEIMDYKYKIIYTKIFDDIIYPIFKKYDDITEIPNPEEYMVEKYVNQMENYKKGNSLFVFIDGFLKTIFDLNYISVYESLI